MRYVDGFVAAVPADGREAFLAHARAFSEVMMELGCLRVVDAWGDEVPDGALTSFPMAVRKAEDEVVVFSWAEWPDKATRDAAMRRMRDDPRLSSEAMPMPFDGKRLIHGGFTPIHDVGRD